MDQIKFNGECKAWHGVRGFPKDCRLRVIEPSGGQCVPLVRVATEDGNKPLITARLTGGWISLFDFAMSLLGQLPAAWFLRNPDETERLRRLLRIIDAGTDTKKP